MNFQQLETSSDYPPKLISGYNKELSNPDRLNILGHFF